MNYNELSRRIRETFKFHVIPSNVLHVFHKYDSDVLTKNDIDFVKACNRHSGNIEAANELLDRLIIYKDWFSCLLMVLRDKDVKLSHIADEFQKTFQLLKEEYGQDLDADYPEMVPQQESKAAMNNNSLKAWNPSIHEVVRGADSAVEKSQIPLSSQTVEKRLLSQPSENVHLSDLSTRIYSMGLHPTASNNQSPFVSLDDPLNVSVATVGPVSRLSFRVEDDVASPNKGDSNLTSLQIVIPDNRSGLERAVTSGLPERDFGQEEVYFELNSLPGWCKLVNSVEIRKMLQPHLGTPGNYVIWFWEKHARPAISFTLNGEIATFIFHKRQATEGSSKIEYYLTKDSKMFESLRGMAEYCITKGVIAKSDQNTEFRVTFKHPVESR